MQTAIAKINSRSAQVAVIGLGYVGLPLAVEVAQAGFKTIGIDLSSEKVSKINRGENYIQDIPDETIRRLVEQKKLTATSDFTRLKECDFVSICVPTPLGKGKEPDMSYILSAVTEVKKNLTPGQVVILESTTYPGTTEEIVLPLLEETGLKAGRDFHLAFSPERIDPGNKIYHLKNTPKVIGGITSQCTEAVEALYHTFIERVIKVHSPRAAEMVKILENTFRAVNIGLANEIAIMCNRLNIDTWEVIEAAATKPFGFMPFYPGPGLGGHCIPVDPHYLFWKLKMMDYHARFIHLADEINSSMSKFVTEKVVEALNHYKKPVNGSKILVLGAAYKKNIDDYRESPAIDIIHYLKVRGGEVFYHDPFIPHIYVDGLDLTSIPLDKTVSSFDCVVIVTDHSCFEMEKLVREAQLIVDTRNATKGIHDPLSKIVKL